MGTIFSAYDIRGRKDDQLTAEYAWTVGKAFAEWNMTEGSVALVKAPDADGTIAHAFAEGAMLQGRDVVDCGEGNDQNVLAVISEGKAVCGVLIGHEAAQAIETIALYDDRGIAVTAETGLTDISGLIDAGNFLPAPTKGNLIAVQ